MKRFKLSPLVTAVMVFEFTVAPTLAHAQGVEAVLGAVNSTFQAYSQAQGMAGATNIDLTLFNQQKTPQNDDKYFTYANMSKIPGLVQYMQSKGLNPNQLQCAGLRSSLHEIKFDGCSATPSQIGINFQTAGAQADEFRKQYEEIAKVYRNYALESTGQGQAFGVGCMKNAMQILTGFFNFRMNELDKLTSDIDAATNKFKEDARTDMNAIEENTAVLDGGRGELASMVTTRRPDLFEFGKRFDNAECRSMFPVDTYNKSGRSGGLNRINQELKDRMGETSGKYSGESYSAAHQVVLNDINDLANKVKNQVNLDFNSISSNANGYRNFVTGLPNSVASTEGIQSVLNGSFFADIQSQYSAANKPLQDEFALISGEIGGQGNRVMQLATNPEAGGFEEELTSLKNSIQNKCLADTLVGSNSISNVLGRMDTNKSSSFAMQNASNIKPRIQQILSNPSTSAEKKAELLQALDRETGNRYFIVMDNSYEYTEVVNEASKQTRTVRVEATNSNTPGRYFTNMIRNCQAQFVSNNLNNKMSGSDAIARIRALRQKYNTQRQTLSNNMFNEVKRKLINCSTPAQANNSVAGSCTPDSFNPTTPGFCANGAFDCSTKMKKCNASAQKFVDEIKADRTARVNNYKNRVEVFRASVNNLFETARQLFAAQGGILNGVFGAGYSAPQGVETTPTDDEKYIGLLRQATTSSPDGALLLEDPIAISNMLKRNVEKLKESVRSQQEEIIEGSNSPLKAHLTNTQRLYEEVANQASALAGKCGQGKAFYDNALLAQQSRMTELGEKRNQLCAIFQAGDADQPASFCGGNITDMMSSDPVAVRRLQAFCRQYNNNDENNNDSNIDDYCIELGNANIPGNKTRSTLERFTENNESEEQYNCRIRLFCSNSGTSATSGGTASGQQAAVVATPAPNCTSVNGLILGYIRKAASNSEEVETPDAPAYCAAGNSDTTRTGDLFGSSGSQVAGGPAGIGR
jgi:hypothetical protein